MRAAELLAELYHTRYQGAAEQRKLPATSPKANFLQHQHECRAGTKSHASGGLWPGVSTLARQMDANQRLQAPEGRHIRACPAGITSSPCESTMGRGSRSKPCVPVHSAQSSSAESQPSYVGQALWGCKDPCLAPVRVLATVRAI